METIENLVLKVDDKIRIDKCESCPKLIGRTVVITDVLSGDSSEGEIKLLVNYGRGRPQAGRPEFLVTDDVSLVVE